MSKGKSKNKKSQKPRKEPSKPNEQETVSQPPPAETPAKPTIVSGIEKSDSAGETFQPTEQQALPVETMIKGGPIPGVRGSDPKAKDFIPEVLGKTVIALPLFRKFDEERKKSEDEEKRTGKKRPEPLYDVIIDVNLLFHAGRHGAKKELLSLISEVLNEEHKNSSEAQQGVYVTKTMFSQQYVFAKLTEEVIKELVKRDGDRANNEVSSETKGTTEGAPTAKPKETKRGRAIYHVWPDFEVEKLTYVSISTVKADAAHNAFAALGKDIVWAVMDSGIDGEHPHFAKHKNLVPFEEGDPLLHRDFTAYSSDISLLDLDDPAVLRKNLLARSENEKPLTDEYGHGTHVAGIIAGEMKATENNQMVATIMTRDQNNNPFSEDKPIDTDISGMAPRCKLVSLKVLDHAGSGSTSNLIAAIAWIQEINGHGRHIRIHGVNMSVGYEYDPQWFACGQSPLCVEVNRLVKSGVVVVVAAGNTGYGLVFAHGKQAAVTAGLDLTINDPGNADLAITVGSTHREMPHIYGVSYFSSKGPTGDGRLKPDLLAPGEKIISCHSSHGENARQSSNSLAYYKEDSGTSMAAPHVSGVIAAFLSVRKEFIGQPEAVKEIFMSTATDLKRERYFQGHGLVDLMRAIQSV